MRFRLVFGLAFVMAVPIPTRAQPHADSKILSQKVTKAWKDRNLIPGWFAQIRYHGYLGFEGNKEMIFGESLPAFERYGTWEVGKLNGLPEPEVAFVLQVRDPKISIDHIREFSRLKNLKGLSFMTSELTPDTLAEVVKLVQLEYLMFYPGRSRRIGDNDLKQISKLKNLRVLGLRGNDLSDAGLPELLACEKLEHLEIGENLRLTDVGMKSIAKMKNLRFLDISMTRVTDTGLKEVGTMLKLQGLDLLSLSLTDAGVKHLSGLADLRFLRLYENKITDASVSVIAGMTKLEFLELRRLSLTDSGLNRLSGLGSLWHLDLSDTSITDSSVGTLQGYRNISQLDVRNTKLTTKGVQALRDVHPKANIRE